MTSEDFAALKADLIRDEGVRLRLYRDTKGIWTIGVGRNLVSKGISMPEAMFLLDNDIAEGVAELNRYVPWWLSLSGSRQRVLGNLCLNNGIDALLGFHRFLDAAKSGDTEMAAAEIEDSKAATEAPSRYHRLAQAWRQG